MKSTTPRVSVGMPVYNGERYINEAVDSIIAQTFDDFDLIISDNASTDRTEEICRQYAAKDERVRYFRNEKNFGAAWNYNSVFNLSTGSYFKWAAADDVCAPEFLERCIEVLDHNPDVVLCYPRTTFIDENSEATEAYLDELNLQSNKPHARYKRFHERFRSRTRCNPVFGLIRRSSLEKTRLIGNFTSSDRVLLAELALLGKFYEVPDNLFFRRDHIQSSVRAYPSAIERATWFDPEGRRVNQLPKWRLIFEYIKSVSLVRIGWYEKTICYIQTVKWLCWDRRKLKKELIAVGYSVVLQFPRPFFNMLRFILRFTTRISRRIITSISFISKIFFNSKTI